MRDNLSVNTAFNEFSHPISVSVLPGGTFQGMGLIYSKYRFPYLAGSCHAVQKFTFPRCFKP